MEKFRKKHAKGHTKTLFTARSQNMKNKLLSIVIILILIANTFAFAACDDGSTQAGGGNTVSGSDATVEKCNVYFEGTSLSPKSVDKNSILQKPASPADKKDSQFAGWYTDSSYNTPVTFPTVIKSDTKLYAKYVPFKDYFLMARENTVGESLSGFEYNYKLDISVSVPIAGTVNGIQEGTSKYCTTNDVSYFDHHKNSGLLFNDGQIYEYKNGQTFNKIEQDETGKIVDFESRIDTSSNKIEFSGFTKALFAYEAADIRSVKKDGGNYIIKTKANASNIGSLVLNYIDNPIVERALHTNLPNTESESSVKVTYNDEKISSYEYVFEVSVSLVTMTIRYTIDFKNTSEIPKMNLPTFNGLSVKSEEINGHLKTINEAIDKFKNAEVSSNEFVLKTAVDYGFTANEINATIAGKSKRSNDNGNVDFINLIEVDSDFKNDDLYKDIGLKDVKFIRGNTSDGTVYDRSKKLIGYDTPVKVSNSDKLDFDKYCLLLGTNFFDYANINSISVYTENNNTQYSLTLTESGAFALYDYINEYAIVNPFVANNIKILGDYDRETFSLSKVDFVITLDKTTNSLISVSIKLKSKCEVKFEDSKDFKIPNRASINIDLSFKTTNEVKAYDAPKNANDLKY